MTRRNDQDRFSHPAPTPAQVIAVLSRLRVPYCPERPHAKQAAFLSLHHREALYGGAARGGKTVALLMAALQYVDVPGYMALLLRKTYADLSQAGAILDLCRDWLGPTDAQWVDKERAWRFPNGAALAFGYLDHPHDMYRYQGTEWHFIGFDELTQFPLRSYRYLFSRQSRPAHYPVPLRMRAATNPGGVHGDWVYRRFFLERSPDRIFIPAKVADNPSVDQAAYVQSLDHLDPVTRAQLLDGNWLVRREGLVYPDFARCIVEPRELPGGTAIGGIDFGYHNPFAALAAVLDHEGVLWVHWERYRRGVAISEHSRALPRGAITWYADPAGADQIAELRRADHAVRQAPSAIMAGIDRVSQRIRTGRLKVFSTCRATIEEAGLYAYEDQGDEPGADEVGDAAERRRSENPIDKYNHAMAALRYMIAGIDRGRAAAIDGPPDSRELDRDPWAEQSYRI